MATNSFLSSPRKTVMDALQNYTGLNFEMRLNWIREHKVFDPRFNYNRFLAEVEMPHFAVPISHSLKKFFARMEQKSSDVPTLNEMLSFFTLLHKLCQVQKKNPNNHAAQYACADKLTLLADGRWNDNLANQRITPSFS